MYYIIGQCILLSFFNIFIYILFQYISDLIFWG